MNALLMGATVLGDVWNFRSVTVVIVILLHIFSLLFDVPGVCVCVCQSGLKYGRDLFVLFVVVRTLDEIFR